MAGFSNANAVDRAVNGTAQRRLIEPQRGELGGRPGIALADGEAGALARREVRLTPRQLECLRWAGEGKSSVDIAIILNISPATVDGHIADACGRLGVRTRIQAIVEAYRRRWLQ